MEEEKWSVYLFLFLFSPYIHSLWFYAGKQQKEVIELPVFSYKCPFKKGEYNKVGVLSAALICKENCILKSLLELWEQGYLQTGKLGYETQMEGNAFQREGIMHPAN